MSFRLIPAVLSMDTKLKPYAILIFF